MKKPVLDSSLHSTRGSKSRGLPIAGKDSFGVTFVKRAHMWCAYHNFNCEKATNQIFWFSTIEQAQAKLAELQT